MVTKEGNKIDEHKFSYLYPIKSCDFEFDTTVPNYYECRFFKYSYDSDLLFKICDPSILYGLYDSKNCTIALPSKFKEFDYYSHNLVYAKTADDKNIVIDKCGNQLQKERFLIFDFYNYDVVIDLEKKSVSVFDSNDIETLNDYGIDV